MSDELDTMEDQQLSELFAVELVGWRKHEATRESPVVRDGMRLPNYFETRDSVDAWTLPNSAEHTGVYARPPSFATKADELFPWLEKHKCAVPSWASGSWSVTIYDETGEGEEYDMPILGDADANTFARAAATALIRAHRAAASAVVPASETVQQPPATP